MILVGVANIRLSGGPLVCKWFRVIGWRTQFLEYALDFRLFSYSALSPFEKRCCVLVS